MTFQYTPPRCNDEPPSFVIIATLLILLWRTDGALPEYDTVAAIFCDVVVIVSAAAKTKHQRHNTLLTALAE
jgi:hypothetical protein